MIYWAIIIFVGNVPFSRDEGVDAMLSILMMLIISMHMSLHPKKQTIYDIIAGTYIVYEESSE